MLQDIKADIEKLIALYEGQKQRADELALRLAEREGENLRYKEQITDLNRQIDNLKLQSAFSADGSNRAAKERLRKLISEIDKCINLLEK